MGWLVGLVLRQTRRTNKDGSVVTYLQLAHNERHPVTGVSTTKVIHNFGRAESVDRDALARMVASISRFLTPEQAMVVAAGAQVQVRDSRRLGGVWVLDQIWDRVGIGAAIRRVAQRRRPDGEATERVLFALVAQRALEPGSKLAGTRWVAERVTIDRCPGFSDDAAYAAMDFLLDTLPEIAGEIFASVAHLLNLDLDIVFVDSPANRRLGRLRPRESPFTGQSDHNMFGFTPHQDWPVNGDSSSTHGQVDVPDELVELADPLAGDDGVTRPTEQAVRRFGHSKSKDHRDDLPQVVIALAVTRDGVPVRCWTFPGTTNDQAIIRRVTDDLGSWNLRRLVWSPTEDSPVR